MKALYTVFEYKEAVAQFIYLEDACYFARAATANTDRHLTVKNNKGHVEVWYPAIAGNVVNITPGTKFQILLGLPREGTVTKVTTNNVHYNVTASNGEIIPEVTTRSMFENPAMIEMSA